MTELAQPSSRFREIARGKLGDAHEQDHVELPLRHRLQPAPQILSMDHVCRQITRLPKHFSDVPRERDVRLDEQHLQTILCHDYCWSPVPTRRFAGERKPSLA